MKIRVFTAGLITVSLLFLAGCSEKQQQSAAMERFTVNDSENEFYTRFRYQSVDGLGYEEGVNRRDASSIIRVDDLYYVWYTRNTDSLSSWLNADIWYATSPDGLCWTEQGPAAF